jgi:hypothetical protein
VRLNKFYSDLLANNMNKKRLWTVVKLVLVLSHKNASVERGFSASTKLLIENMFEETVVAQRVVCDAILTSGMDVKNIHVNPKMLASVRQSHAAYKAGLLAKQQKENKKQLKVEEKKRKSLISSLQLQKKIEMQEMRAETTEIDNQIAELESSK